MTILDERLWYLHERILPDVFALLPARMTSVPAEAELLAIALQETGLEHRTQVPVPHAHGLWQFELRGGVTEILSSPVTRPLVRPICDLLLYDATPDVCYAAISHNDVLAGVFARLLLWLHPATLPSRTEPAKGYQQYLARWKPNKTKAAARAHEWPGHFRRAWAVAAGD